MKPHLLSFALLTFFTPLLARADTLSPSLASPLKAIHIQVPKVYEEGGKGLYPDILREVFKSTPTTWVFKIAPSYARVMHEISVEKSSDIFMGVYQAEIAEYDKGLEGKRAMACSTSHMDADQVIALFPKGKVPTDWKGKETLLNKPIGWTNEYGYETYLFNKELEKKGGRFTEFNEIEKGLKMLQVGRLYAYLMPYQEYIETSFKDQFEYRNVQLLPLHVCFPKDERGLSLKKQYEEGMEKIKKNGRLKELFKKWYVNGYYPY